MEKVFITGVTGQIASYLAELALKKGCEVHGLIRRSSSFNLGRIEHLYNNAEIINKRLFLHYGDMCDSGSLYKIIDKVQPNMVFNLAAQSHVKISFDTPEYTADVTGLGVIRLLDAIKNINPSIKFLQMSSSEMYGGISGMTQLSETSPFHPRSPYGCAKMFGYWATINYRESYDMFCSNSITFNTESPRRGENFFPKKVTQAVARIVANKQEYIPLGNLNSYRDWTLASDTCDGLWKILEHNKADDFVLSSDETHSMKEFVELSFKEVDIDIEWIGKGLDEKGIDSKTGRELVIVDEKFFRPSEVDVLYGCSEKARTQLGWKPKTSFKELVHIMMQHDLKEQGVI
jgi:GDPmannose 4,6-dehydratase